jgi:tetratricopeptide (TPR) repeat protein
MFAGINVSKAQAREFADRDAILALMRGRETEVNNVTMLGIKDWLVKQAGGLGFANGSKEEVRAMNVIGAMLEAMGSLDEALRYREKAVKLAGPAFGANSSEYAAFLNNLAGLNESQGKYDEAEPLYNESLAIRKRALGNDHPTTKRYRKDWGN